MATENSKSFREAYAEFAHALRQLRPEDQPKPFTSVPGPLKPVVEALLNEKPRFTEETFTDRVRVQIYAVKDLTTGKKIETPHTFKCGFSEIYTAREDAFNCTNITVEPGKTVEVDVSLEVQINFYPQQKFIIYESAEPGFYAEGIVIQSLSSVEKQPYWLHTIKCFKTRRNLRLFEFGSGATLITSNEAVFILESKSMAVDFEFELHLDKRICVYPQRKFVICEKGIIGEGVFTRPLPSCLEPTLAEKLMEDFEFIPGDLAVQIRKEIQNREAQPFCSHLDIVD